MTAIKIVIERKSPSVSEGQEFRTNRSRERRHTSLSGKGSFIVASVMLAILAIGAIVSLNWPSTTPHNSASQKILAQVRDFTPYFFPNGSSVDGFRLATTNGMVYSDGVLFISVDDMANQEVTITEQALPDALAHSTDVIGDEPVDGVDGKAAIAHVDGHTTGSMISHDHRTLITLNCPNTVATSAVMDLMRSLSPATGR